jgi:hypothetical protein
MSSGALYSVIELGDDNYGVGRKGPGRSPLQLQCNPIAIRSLHRRDPLVRVLRRKFLKGTHVSLYTSIFKFENRWTDLDEIRY